MENQNSYLTTKAAAQELMSEHIQVAREMAYALIERFNLDYQNEAVRHIKEVLQKERMAKIENLEKEISYTKDCLEGLGR